MNAAPSSARFRGRTRSAAKFLPEDRTLENLRTAAGACRGCELYKQATQTVFGEGRADADLFLVGEQPGNREDLEGRPFVGPAGGVLSKCLAEAGIEPSRVYVTNAVKHFKWTPRGKVRLHKKPDLPEIAACRPWLDAEIAAVEPKLILCLGATASQALLGRSFRLTRHHGEVLHAAGLPPILATIHPSAVLRAPDHAGRE